MTARQLTEWLIFSELEPFDSERNDYRFGSIVQVLANAHRDIKKHPKGFTLDDVTLFFGDKERSKPKPQSWQEMKMIAYQMTALFNKDQEWQ